MEGVFFVASKLVWALLKPGTWIVLFVGFAFVAAVRGAYRFGGAMAGITFLALVGLSVFPVGILLLRPLEKSYEPNHELSEVAGIIILGGGEDTRLSGRWNQPLMNDSGDRFMAGLSLARRHPEAIVMFTGGIGSLRQDGPSGADVAEEILLSAGLPGERLVLERTSRNTAQNARNSLELRPRSAEGAWFLVTSAFHMPRAVETFCAAGWQNLVPWPTDYRTNDFSDTIGWDLVGNLAMLETGVKEYVGIVAYRWTGRASGALPEDCLFAPGGVPNSRL